MIRGQTGRLWVRLVFLVLLPAPLIAMAGCYWAEGF